MEVNLISLFLLVLSWNIHFCNAQTFSSLAPSNAMQAIGSDVDVTTTVTTSPPFTATWRINGIDVGTASVNSAGTATAGAVTTGTIYESRVDISAGSYTSNQYTTVLTIQALLASEDGITVDVGTPGIYDTSLNLTIQECSLNTTAYPSLTFTCDDSSCEFNSAGTLLCAEGYTTSGVSTTSTTCQADTTLTNLDVLSCVESMSATTTISTAPPYNALATGFNNLIVTAQFPTPTDTTDSCSWFYGGELGNGSGAFYATLGGCDPSPSNVNRSVTCTIDATYHIITTLTITQPLVAGNINIEVRCLVATTPGPITRTVQDCPSSLPHDVIISSSLGTYQANAMFSCPPGRELYYSNSTALPSGDTTCLANAKWNGQDNLQCWSAPDVTLNGDLNIVENDDITLTCDYDVTVIPNGTSSIFYFGNVGYTLNKDDAFSRTLQREDNMKLISCQAITPYTEVNNSTGQSLTETVNVMYISSSVSNKIETSQYVIEASESNYLLRSDQQLTMNCIPSDANPPATCSWQLCSDSRCQTLTSDGGCLITVDLNASSTVTCAAENVVGNVSSTEQTVDVIPVERQVQFNVSGSNITNDGSINSTTYLGESIMISCSVSYENEMSTTYLIKLPDSSMISQSSKMFSSVTRDDTGDYICITKDQFGNFNAAIYLNVICKFCKVL
ncbi:unnamed protein product [Clavelina lepadiformis]|uniref:Immunoglobulin domain-containing protein n=1 Tax=Clavelina lepadiformis TaxID=159417 RepID=A0ABP0FFR9_CLALP